MGEKVKINVVIGGRTYPLYVSNEIEEEGTRKAAEKINQLISRYERDYAVNDKQDVLAMSALQFASKLEIMTLLKDENLLKAEDKLVQMQKLLDEHLK